MLLTVAAIPCVMLMRTAKVTKSAEPTVLE